MTTPHVGRAWRGVLPLVLGAAWMPPSMVEDSPGPNQSSAYAGGELAAGAADTTDTATILRRDTTVRHLRGADRREVQITITIRAPWEVVVLEPRIEGAGPKWGDLEVIEVNSVRALAPERLRHIEIRPGAVDSLPVSLLVRLPHCARLDFGVWGYAGGRAVDHPGLRQRSKDLPDCCETSEALGLTQWPRSEGAQPGVGDQNDASDDPRYTHARSHLVNQPSQQPPGET